MRANTLKRVRRSLVQFRTHPLRTALALLGMVLGVSSVIGMMSIGEGAQKEILASIETLGGDVVHVKAKDVPSEKIPEIVNESKGLAVSDIDAIEHVVSGIRASGFEHWSDIIVSDLPASTYNVRLAAVSPSIFDLHRLTLAFGRRILDVDDAHARRVAVIGADVADSFPGGAALAIGKRVRIGYAYFEIVGVLAKKKNGGGDLPLDPEQYNKSVVIPFHTAAEEISPLEAYREVDVISLRVNGLADTLEKKRAITPVLRALHGGKDDFDVTAPEEILEKKRSAQSILNLVLISIAAISLLVGGIGVMNIMLANIMERITEIGLRRAIGASGADIRDQFLIEAVVVCFIGGMIGVVVGYGGSFLVGVLFHLPIAFAWTAMILSFSLSLAVGLASGLWPAMRAARVNPVEALQRG
jgi:putative ABC transport system permease protein